MASNAETGDARDHSATDPSRVPRPWADRVWLIVVVASHLPFVVFHSVSLWRYRPHYEFSVVLVAVCAWLMWKRWPSETVHSKTSRLTARSLLLLGLVCLAASVVLFWPWLGAVAAVFSTGGLLLLLAGRGAFCRLSSVWLLLWVAIPPPFGLDRQLIRLLQSLTAHTSSMFLEMMRVNHVLAGNVFRTPDRELFVAEACSGINSQLVLIAASAVLVILLRRTWLHAILLIAASVFWSVVVNTTRVTLIVLVAVQWNIDLSDGWQHEVLGHGLALVGILLLFSTDQFLAGLFAPVLNFRAAEMGGGHEGVPLASDPLSRLWNAAIAWKLERTPEPSETVDASTSSQPAVNRSPFALTAFGCLGVVQLVSVVVLVTAQTPEVRVGSLDTAIHEDWLPERLASWQRIEYETVERELGSDEGEHSSKWTYQFQDHKAIVSVDYPFLGWHELTCCYTDGRETCGASGEGRRSFRPGRFEQAGWRGGLFVV